VQRVLARYWGYRADLGRSAHKKELWAWAQALLPRRDLARTMPAYTQGIMDLGATVCKARQPVCSVCPLASGCVALAGGQPTALPYISKTLKRREQAMYLHWQQCGDDLRLERRPSQGLWGGLYCLPELSAEHYAALAAQEGAVCLPVFKHVLTHRDLQLHIVQQQGAGNAACAKGDAGPQADWFAWPQIRGLGLPQPIAKLLGSA
jgi:A/G-specific adenine glycosylase